MDKQKPTKRQMAILEMLSKIEYEGMEYAFAQYGMDDYLDKLGDEDLNEAVKKFVDAWHLLSDHMTLLEKEVEEFDFDVDLEDLE